MLALCGLALLSITIGLSANGWLPGIKIGCNVYMCSMHHRWGYLVKHASLTCNWNKSTPRKLYCRHRTLLYPSRSRHGMQCFYANRLVWPMDSFPITYIPTRDGNMTNSTESTDDVLTVANVLSVALPVSAAHWVICKQYLQIHNPWNSIHVEYELMY